MDASPDPWLLVGLGNPGRDYERTRHNIGFLALDRMAAAEGAAFSESAKLQGAAVRLPGAILLKPLTFMNLSGRSARAAADFYKIPAGRVLAVVDDAALGFGRLRLRARGGDGGHNGLASMIAHLGTEAFPRLRIGIGVPPAPVSLHDHVLGRFTAAEWHEVPAVLDAAAAAVACVLKNGLEAAMNQFNKGGL